MDTMDAQRCVMVPSTWVLQEKPMRGTVPLFSLGASRYPILQTMALLTQLNKRTVDTE